MHPRSLQIADYAYHLPDEQIAKHPLADRDRSRLLMYRKGEITETQFCSLPDFIPAQAQLIFNTTRVVRARMLMQRETGGRIEIFCTDSAQATVPFSLLLQQKNTVDILAFVGNAKRWKEAEILETKLDDGSLILQAKRIGISNDQSMVQLTWEPSALSFAEVLEATGKIPLPPYIDREEEADDSDRYQTVYAKEKGSVAAPTAGLHFSDQVMRQLKEKQVHFSELTLHVGAGTFKPVKSETMQDHEMHREQIIVSYETVISLLDAAKQPVIAVGTTSARSLESLYWFGRQLVLNPGVHVHELFVSQWEPYTDGPEVPVPVALRAVADWMREQNKNEITGHTQLMIAPSYRFRIVKGLITNFHQPQSTLLLLVAAFIGEDYRKVYEYALQHDFRFLSYGDGSLLWGKDC
jgi:S-adenosylmethionine:tRNA ribosyltransferase-isomerase